MTYISQYYYNWKQAEMAKKQVLEISGLNINLTGKLIRDFLGKDRRCFLSGQLGKRTRYQINNTSQLLVDINRKESLVKDNETDVENQILPKVNID